MFSSLNYIKCGGRVMSKLQLSRQLAPTSSQHSNTQQQHQHRHFSRTTCDQRIYDLLDRRQKMNLDLKPDAVEMFKYGVRSVRPRQMIENVLEFNRNASVLRIQNRSYQLNKNVFVVGFGKAVLGMARVVENVLGDHIRAGVLSIPKGLPEQLRDSENFDAMLSPNSKIVLYEGAGDNRADECAFNAAKAIHNLIANLTENDLVIVLCSGGGSVLCPYPQPPISLEELRETIHILSHHAGGSIKDINTVRKNIEVLKGGGLALKAKPAKVISLILSSIIGDPVDLIAGGPTHPTRPTPHQCMEIFQRLHIVDKIPTSVKKYLEKEITATSVSALQQKNSVVARRDFDEIWSQVQNVVVGNNSIACEAAAIKAKELGYLPLILTKDLCGEAHIVGMLYGKLCKFIQLCFDRNISSGPNSDLATLELELVGGGIRKERMNLITKMVDVAHNSDQDFCIISGGETYVQVDGKGVGGKNMELALAAAIQVKRNFQNDENSSSETSTAFLSADTDGYDGLTQMSGAVIDHDFLSKVEKSCLDMNSYLGNHDSFTLFSQVNDGQNLVNTKLTGTNVMDIVILLVAKPRN